VSATAVRPRGRGRNDSLLRTAARGAALIGVAVVIGIVLLQVVDTPSPVGSGGPVSPATAAPNGATTTTTAGDVRPPQEVRVLVLNGSGVAMAAATEANKLRGLGYPIAGTGNAATTPGTTVACLTGFEKEAEALAKSVGEGVTVATFPTTPPAGAENADCIVTVGQ